METSGATLSDLLEVYLDGPKEEADMFRRSTDGALLFTPFSRSCQQEWIMKHGRRFACNRKRRKNANVSKTGWRLAGTDKAVQLGQRAATLSLKRVAKRGASVRTFLGDSTADYAEAGRGTPDALRKFRNFTKLRIRAKRMRAAAGSSASVPELVFRVAAPGAERALAKSASRALAKSASRQNLLAAVRDSPPAMFVHGLPLEMDLAGVVQNASLRMAKVVVVPALTDLDTKTMHARDFIVWLVVIAAGKSLLARSALTRDSVADETMWLRHESARRFKQCVGLCADFARVEPRLASALHEQAACAGSKWQVQVGADWRSERDGGPVVISSLSTFQSFLRRARRVYRAHSQHGTYCKRAAVASEPR